MTDVQRRVLRKAQEHDSLFPMHSRKSLHCRESTLRALSYAGYLEWCDRTDDGIEEITYYMLTDAGRNVGKEIRA